MPNLRYEMPNELPSLRPCSGNSALPAIEIQHFLHLDARVIEMVRALKTPYDVYVHDYAWICPRVTLIDGSGRYCGEPAVSVCKICVKRNGSNLREKISVPALRERSDAWLRQARRVIAPSNDTAERLRQHFRGMDIEVRAHATPVVPTRPSPKGPGAVAARRTHRGYRDA